MPLHIWLTALSWVAPFSGLHTSLFRHPDHCWKISVIGSQSALRNTALYFSWSYGHTFYMLCRALPLTPSWKQSQVGPLIRGVSVLWLDSQPAAVRKHLPSRHLLQREHEERLKRATYHSPLHPWQRRASRVWVCCSSIKAESNWSVGQPLQINQSCQFACIAQKGINTAVQFSV